MNYSLALLYEAFEMEIFSKMLISTSSLRSSVPISIIALGFTIRGAKMALYAKWGAPLLYDVSISSTEAYPNTISGYAANTMLQLFAILHWQLDY